MRISAEVRANSKGVAWNNFRFVFFFRKKKTLLSHVYLDAFCLVMFYQIINFPLRTRTALYVQTICQFDDNNNGNITATAKITQICAYT